MTCFECNLPDPYNGAGDGIGSCDCPRCEACGWPPGICNHDDYDAFGDPAEDEEYEPLDHPDRNPETVVELPAGDVR